MEKVKEFFSSKEDLTLEIEELIAKYLVSFKMSQNSSNSKTTGINRVLYDFPLSHIIEKMIPISKKYRILWAQLKKKKEANLNKLSFTFSEYPF